jgi:hypothetical protein
MTGSHRAVARAREDVEQAATRTVLGDHAGGAVAGAQEHYDVGVPQHGHEPGLLPQLLQQVAILGAPAAHQHHTLWHHALARTLSACGQTRNIGTGQD